MNVIRQPDGRLEIIDGDTYQYNQERGLIIIDSPEVGLVAVLPIGMSFVSSVSLTPEIGARLQKGEHQVSGRLVSGNPSAAQLALAHRHPEHIKVSRCD